MPSAAWDRFYESYFGDPYMAWHDGLDEVALITREGTPFCATFEPRVALRVGDEVDVAVDVRRLHFFDPDTESAIGA